MLFYFCSISIPCEIRSFTYQIDWTDLNVSHFFYQPSQLIAKRTLNCRVRSVFGIWIFICVKNTFARANTSLSIEHVACIIKNTLFLKTGQLTLYVELIVVCMHYAPFRKIDLLKACEGVFLLCFLGQSVI